MGGVPRLAREFWGLSHRLVTLITPFDHEVEEGALHPSWGALEPWKEEALAALRAAILVGRRVGTLMHVPDDEACCTRHGDIPFFFLFLVCPFAFRVDVFTTYLGMYFMERAFLLRPSAPPLTSTFTLAYSSAARVLFSVSVLCSRVSSRHAKHRSDVVDAGRTQLLLLYCHRCDY